MNDRIIKLAEAIGWHKSERDGGSVGMYHVWVKPNGEDDTPGRLSGLPNFDPFTDANDDYAALEWMRAKYQPEDDLYFVTTCLCEMGHGLTVNYKIGDYARAAISVLEIPLTVPDTDT